MRAPFQVVVFPFRRKASSEFAIFLRSDLKIWQGLAGGGKMGELPLQAAKRESFEEGAVPESAPFYALESRSSVPVSIIGAAARSHWPSSLFVIPNYAFGVELADDFEPTLSDEHSSFVWCEYNDARARLHYQNNQVAIEELYLRIVNNALPVSH